MSLMCIGDLLPAPAWPSILVGDLISRTARYSYSTALAADQDLGPQQYQLNPAFRSSLARSSRSISCTTNHNGSHDSQRLNAHSRVQPRTTIILFRVAGEAETGTTDTRVVAPVPGGSSCTSRIRRAIDAVRDADDHMHDTLVSNKQCIVRWPGYGIPSSVVEDAAMLRRCAAPANQVFRVTKQASKHGTVRRDVTEELDPVSNHESLTFSTAFVVDPASDPKSKRGEAAARDGPLFYASSTNRASCRLWSSDLTTRKLGGSVTCSTTGLFTAVPIRYDNNRPQSRPRLSTTKAVFQQR